MDIEVIKNELKGLPQPVDKVLLRPHQMVNYQKDIEQCNADLKNPGIQKRGEVMKRKRQLEYQFNDQAPQPVTDPILRDKAGKILKSIKDKVRVGMPTEEEMRKASNTTVEQHRRWERANKKLIGVMRNIERQLETDTSDPDTWDRSLGDTEKLRPRSVAQSRYVSDALIPGKFSMSDLPSENWDQIFDHQPNSALEQAKKVQAAVKAEPKTRRPLTEEEKAKKAEILKKARAVAAMKRQAQGSTSTEPVSVQE
jgi:hypothetical protein